MPTRARTAAALVCGARIVYAVGLIAAPARLAQSWLGPPVVQPSTQIPLRGLAVRELGLATGGLLASLSGAPVRPWLVAQIAGDLSDILASVAGSNGIPPSAVGAVTAVAGASATLTAGAAVAVVS
jgi:hypothetical protein